MFTHTSAHTQSYVYKYIFKIYAYIKTDKLKRQSTNSKITKD